MSLIALIIILCVVGAIMYAVNTYLPLDPNIRKIINFVVIVVVILWLLSVFNILPDLNAIKVGGN